MGLAFFICKPYDLHMKPQAAVLTGDLIASSRASSDAVSNAMEAISNCFGAAYGFSRSRGDGWQIYFDNAGYGLWAAVRIVATLRAAEGLQSRIAVGLGSAEQVDLSDLSTASGSAFVASGRALSGMPKHRTLVLAGDETDPLQDSLLGVVDECMLRWSREQAEAAALAWSCWQHPTQGEIAEHLGISRQAVAARLNSAGFRAIDWAQWQFYLKFATDTGHA